ncbi:ABC transporter substrate-binding protein [Thalassospira sp. TSL5-1]|uniref:substrate-binding periplasmic protein n=1 Tax=Thalassospira sp. TSL5-1 TaxID=1544451 RepID=UPI00093F4968|nr:ABC transporter substrate-binding protein [Thalassospira sp. TSL5-1]OKH86545.1 hypothetical protein LF95_21450 [Thalassospira sp. TSL5-1]
MTWLRNRNWAIGFLAIFLFCGISIIADAHEKPRRNVTLACNPFPPSKIAENLKMPGYDVEILRAAFAVSDIKVKTPFYPWKRAYLLASEGQVDGLCSCSYSVERENDLLYSIELGNARIGLFSIAGHVPQYITKLEDVRNLRIGVVSGYSLEKSAGDAGLNVVTATSEQTLLGMLYTGQIDMIYSFRAPVLVAQKKHNIPFSLEYRELKHAPYYGCISRKIDDAYALVETLNHGLRTIQANGVYNSILKKYGVSEMSLANPTNWIN